MCRQNSFSAHWSCFYKSLSSTGGMGHHISKRDSLIWCFDDDDDDNDDGGGDRRHCQRHGAKIQLGWHLANVTTTTCNSHPFHAHQNTQCCAQEIEHCYPRREPPIRKEMWDHRLEAITSNNCVDLQWPLSLRRQMDPKYSCKMPPTV